MVEYAVLTARSLGQSLGRFSHEIEPSQVIGALAVGLLVWMLWRTFGPR
ncbi:MAG TPA: hypothetical protein VFT04_01305 [Gemmatimonadales bacterium]|nr:hypothetical protein [Gemmatimonadales bacterium]